MGKRQSDIAKLDRVNTALEHLILAAPDKEILAEGSTEAHYLRSIIAESISRCDTSATSSAASSHIVRTKSKKRRTQTLIDWQTKIVFFRNLLETRPDLSPRLGAVFGTGRTPTSEELEDLADDLIKQGLLPKGGPKKK